MDKKEKTPHLYASRGFTMDELVRIYSRYCRDLGDPEEIWIEGYDEFLFYRSDIEIRKSELTNEQAREVRRCDAIVLQNAYQYLEVYEFGLGLLDESHRKTYPKSHWWWYVDEIHFGKMSKPDLSLPI
ncbi:MAG: hypothetical protein SFU91_05205 [Chloroherpetonaceae bacterium]|nr:hypothetical protein [Chloroherpetonaceae bacterium]